MRSVLRTAVMVAAAAGMLAGCGSSSSSSSSSGNPVDITTANIAFSTTDIKIPAGDVTFTVKNDDKVEHNLTIENGNVNKDVEGGKTVKAKATLKAGTYAFHCEYHPDVMKGTITVT
jgi:plastocyanin